MKKLIAFYERNKSILGIIFFIIIPIIIGIIGGTLGYIDKGGLGALAGFIRYGFISFWCFFIFYGFLLNVAEYWEIITMIFIGLLVCFIIWFLYSKLNWLLTNYQFMFQDMKKEAMSFVFEYMDYIGKDCKID